MKSFGTYISKHLASFAAFLLILVIVNVVLYGVTFYHTVSEDYGEASPHAMLELTSTAATTEGLPDYAEQKLRQYNIWAMYLTSTGECFWRLDVPQEVPQHYSIQEVALFSKGYLEDYPVFVWSTEDGLLVLGYPKNSYMKLTSNYYSMETIQKIPLYVIGMLGMDVLCLFLAYYFSKRRIIQNTEPIVDAIETLADGKPVSLHIIMIHPPIIGSFCTLRISDRLQHIFCYFYKVIGFINIGIQIPEIDFLHYVPPFRFTGG